VFSPLEKGAAKVLLHPADLFGERRLAQVQEPSRAAKMQLLPKQHERTKFPHFHNAMLSPK
jgi:hypothetical protein